MLYTFFGLHLNQFIPFAQKMPHIPFQNQPVKQASQNSIRHRVLKGIGHQSTVISRFELMLMSKMSKSSIHHFINKAMWRLKFGDFRSQRLPDAKVPGPPGYGLSQFYQSGGDSANSLFFRLLSGHLMKINTTLKVKAERRAGLNMKLSDNDGQGCVV